VSDGGGDPIFASALIGFPVQFLVYQQLAADNAAAVAQAFLARWDRRPRSRSSRVGGRARGQAAAFAAHVPCLASDAGRVERRGDERRHDRRDGIYARPKLVLAPRTVHVVATSAIRGGVSAVATVSLIKN
jgi:hypothetical protein